MEQKSFERTKQFLEEAKQHGCNTVHAYCRMLHMTKSQENHWYERYKKYKDEFDYRKEHITKNILSDTDTLSDFPEHETNHEHKEEYTPLDNGKDFGGESTSTVRQDGKIIGYRYHILRRGYPDIVGTLSREDMERLCNLYSMYGANLTAAQVHVDFPQFSLAEFQRIRNAFLVYKYTCPFPPHIVEEHSDDELKDLSTQRRTNNLVRNIEKDQIRDITKAARKLADENKKLKDRRQFLSELEKLDIHVSTKPEDYKNSSVNTAVDSENSLVLWLSDMHMGAYNDNNGFYELCRYDEKDIKRRLNIVLETFKGKKYTHIYVVNLGDALDSFNKETTRGGHELPGIMSNKEMASMFLRVMTSFFAKLKAYTSGSEISFLSIGESNHGGDFEWLANIALAERLKAMDIKSYVSSEPIDNFSVSGNTFIFLHGKDNENQSRSFPMTLNPNTELYFANYISKAIPAEKRSNRIYVVKGDLHKYAYTTGQQFDYVSVGSMYGSSNYITANFGDTEWSINYFLIDSDSNVSVGLIRE